MSWILCEDPETILWYLQSMEKCIQTKRHKFSFTNYIYLSLGKLCEDHGYSHGWASGQKPRLPKEGKTIVCKTDNFAPLVVPGLSTSSRSNSSSTSVLRDLPTSPAQERSDAPGDWCRSLPKNPKQKWKRGMTIEIRTTVCEIFLSCWRSSQMIQRTQKCMYPHTVLRTPFRNVLRKWQQKSRKHSICIHFPKHPNCAVCLRKKMTRALCRRRTGETPPRAEMFGDLITADHRRRKGVYESSSSCHRSQ